LGAPVYQELAGEPGAVPPPQLLQKPNQRRRVRNSEMRRAGDLMRKWQKSRKYNYKKAIPGALAWVDAGGGKSPKQPNKKKKFLAKRSDSGPKRRRSDTNINMPGYHKD
jgi:hypothetical protein